jgi:hypothetical protein
MIYVTGDTHGDFSRFSEQAFPAQKWMTRDDCVIICGDFGGVWKDSPEQQAGLDRLNALPFTTLFLDGNHENYDLLASYTVTEWHGGKVQVIQPNVLHLMRGQVYDIGGETFFTMGGAACHDIHNGVLDLKDPDFEQKYKQFRQQKRFFRINHLSWWEQELPTRKELEEALKIICAHEKKVDYVLSHCAPTGLQRKIQAITRDDTHPVNELTEFLQRIYDECEFRSWFCGHYHHSMNVEKNFHVLYESVVPLTRHAPS